MWCLMRQTRGQIFFEITMRSQIEILPISRVVILQYLDQTILFPKGTLALYNIGIKQRRDFQIWRGNL